MNLLVTGAAGFIGSNCCAALARTGHSVRGVDCFSDYYDPALKRRNAASLASSGVAVADADLAADPIDALLEGVDGVLHFAAQPGISATTPWESYFRNNILATHRLVEASRSAGVGRFVNIATSSVYGLHATDPEDGAPPKPASWYGVTKLAAEQEAMAAWRSDGFPACSLRLFSVFGEGERPDKLFPRLLGALARDEPFPLYKGSENHRRSFTYVGDVCEAVIRALERWEQAQGEIFNVGSDQTFTTGEAIAAAEKVMGRRAKFALQPPRPGDQAATSANLDKIRRTLRWEPKTSLEQGLERMARWIESNPRAS